MEKRCCQNCVYAGALEVPCCGATVLVCANQAQCPGRLGVVTGEGQCRNFRVKPRAPARPRPPAASQPAAAAQASAGPQAAAPSDGDILYIPLTQGQVAMIDAADYDRVKPYKWHASFSGGKFYARAYCGGKRISMHRLLMDTPKGMVVDHINGSTLNNRRCNMRNCTRAQNGRNRRPNPGSECPGVRFCAALGLWCACVTKGGKENKAGWFASKEEAIRARDRKAAELFGEFAWLYGAQHARDQGPPGAGDPISGVETNETAGAKGPGLPDAGPCRRCPLRQRSGQWFAAQMGVLLTALVCARPSPCGRRAHRLGRRMTPWFLPGFAREGRYAMFEMTPECNAAIPATHKALTPARGGCASRAGAPWRWTPGAERGPPRRARRDTPRAGGR